MKRTAWLLIIFLLLTNVATLVYHQTKTPPTETYYFLELEGESASWRVREYKVAITPLTTEKGAAAIIYQGEHPQTVEPDITVEFYDEHSPQPYHVSSKRALDDQHSFTTGGSGGNTPSYSRTLKAADLEKTFVRIKWRTLDGQSHQEDVPLRIENSFRHLLDEGNLPSHRE